ncbi:hydantoinase/oxoprolinase family protein [Thermoplasma sp. Kam2015]|uniref:hydantoinase/oxoprolinase family protein n=1 Tax=Thermoplasma sp. Kam2015 TaxID=2094122 RepID=UPI000D9A178B|nr:hydantoinase/oxoprolinase family protein [Thermoplasma sp. Kam2015]PYB68307.1 hydantoinase/oxoprolinase family protein [Thermoplasma sp. Kam2015]
MNEAPLYIGVDIGGTFTDIVIFDSKSNRINILKTPSTPSNPEKAVIDGLLSMHLDPEKVRMINHASTVATNALLTRTGLTPSALITNRGFIDILEIGRQRRAEIYNLDFQRPDPLIARRYRFGVSGRIDSSGRVIEDLNEEEILRIRKKIEDSGLKGVAISLINSYLNPVHEDRIKEIFSDFDGYVFASHEVDPQYREYERTSTTVVNTVLSGIVSSYLRRFREGLKNAGFRSEIYMMGSNGGLSAIDYAERLPISVIESGPSAGVIASANFSRLLGDGKVITFDMGGTTAKAGVVISGRPDLAYEFEAAGKTHSGRSIKGSGYAVRFPFIDLAEVSAGGGTIAWIDEAGSLRVGPKSAGSDPGPAAYNRGGKDPTVTDADIILGRLNPHHLLGGNMKIYRDLAENALSVKIARPLGIDTIDAASGIIRMINNAMSRAISIVSVERGRDPRGFVMYAYGGAGPLHAAELAADLGIGEIMVPSHPGLFSAYGLLSVDMVRDVSIPFVPNSDIGSAFQSLERISIDNMEKEGLHDPLIERFLDIRYVGQSYEITVPYSENYEETFRTEYRRIYGYVSSDPLEIVSLRIRLTIRMPKIGLIEPEKTTDQEIVERSVYISGKMLDTPVMRWSTGHEGFSGGGPFIIEGYDSTIFVPPGWKFKFDRYLNVRMVRS